MSRNIKINYNGIEYNSIAELARKYNLNVVTLRTRLRKGLPIEEAVNKNKFNCTQIEYNGVKFDSIKELCKKLNINQTLLNNRLHQGWNLYDAINKEKNITKQGKTIIINEKIYNSIKEASLDLNIEENKLRRIIRDKNCNIKNNKDTLKIFL